LPQGPIRPCDRGLRPSYPARSDLAFVYYNRGNASRDGKLDYDRATADYDEAIRLDPKIAAAYVGRGDAYSVKHDYDGAISDYDQAIRLDPKYAIAYFRRGAAYISKGDYRRAIADLDQGVRLDPKYAFFRPQ
jgi:tetratricopeptide (TPR) repeat protein